MAGKKQHFIPQHFQRPFAIKEKKAQKQIWQYRRNLRKPVPSSIGDTAAQRYFYSKPATDGTPALDDLITDYETRLSTIVNELRTLQIGDRIDAEKIAEVVTHLNTRSAHMRAVIEGGVTAMVDAGRQLLAGRIDGEALKLPLHRVPTELQRVFTTELAERGFLDQMPVSDYAVNTLLYFMLRERSEELLSEAQNVLAMVVGEIAGRAPNLGKSAQTAALQDAMAPEAKQAQLRELSWTICAAPEPGAILPDCTSIGFDGERWSSLYLADSEALEAVVLPLTPDRLAVGVGKSVRPPELSDFNAHAANASHSFFLSSFTSPELDKLIGEFGGDIPARFASATNEAMVDAVTTFLAHEHDDDAAQLKHAAEQSWHTGDADGSFSFNLQIIDFGDDDLAKALGEQLKTIVTSVTKHLPLGALDGFTFAERYTEAVHDLDRGFPPSKPVELIEDGNSIGVCIPLSVVRGGELKTHIVLRGFLAGDLLATEDEKRKAEAQALVVSMLADVALDGLISKKFPHRVLKPVHDLYEAVIHDYVSGAFPQYFCQTFAALEEHKDFYEELTCSAWTDLIETFPDERVKYHLDADLDRFLAFFGQELGAFLKAAARWLGACKSVNQEIDPKSPLAKMMDDHGLLDWIKLFASDLATFDKSLEAWSAFEEIFFVNRHFERLAAHFMVIMDRSEASGAYIHIPVLEHQALLEAQRERENLLTNEEGAEPSQLH